MFRLKDASGSYLEGIHERQATQSNYATAVSHLLSCPAIRPRAFPQKENQFCQQQDAKESVQAGFVTRLRLASSRWTRHLDMSSYLFFVWGWQTLVCDDPFWFGDQIGAGDDQVVPF